MKVVHRLGVRWLDGNVLHLRNRSNDTAIELTDEQAARWRVYLMAFYGNRGGRRDKPKSDSVRLTGLFKSKKRGLSVGSVEELDPVVAVVKKAIKTEKGLVFFLWRNEEQEEGQPAYTLYMGVSQDRDGRPQRRTIADDDDEDDAPPAARRTSSKTEETDDDVPF